MICSAAVHTHIPGLYTGLHYPSQHCLFDGFDQVLENASRVKDLMTGVKTKGSFQKRKLQTDRGVFPSF